MSIEVRYKMLDETAHPPIQATEGSAGYDLTLTKELKLVSEAPCTVGLGFAVSIPKGYMGLVVPRSSAHKLQVKLGNTVGIIDSDYRGEVLLIVQKTLPFRHVNLNAGTKIAQLIIVPVADANFIEVTDLDSTKRGAGGVGSTTDPGWNGVF